MVELLKEALQKKQQLRIIRRKELERRLGLSRSAIYDRLDPNSPRHDPSFPSAISLGGASRCVGWLEHEVDAYIAALVQSSREAA
ncbi:MAG: AlpA family phage regulatory protein [Gallionella sp.]